MTTHKTELQTPVGRLVQGSLYEPSTTDAENKPLVVKTGPNAGQPRVSFFFAVAIPKGGEQHWSQTGWGQKILAVGQSCFPQAFQSPAFAWKVTDGDSTIPDKKGRTPASREGFPGCWVLRFSGGFAPKVHQFIAAGNVPLMPEKDAVKLGDYVEVLGNVDGNDSANQPGLYLNHSLVCFRGYGPRITVGPDANSVGFGAAPLPPGASVTPIGQALPAGGFPPPLGAVAPAATFPPLAPQAPAPLTVVQPHPQFLQPPGAVAAPAAPGFPAAGFPPPLGAPVLAPASVRQMTALAQGHAYETLIGQGWTDATLVQNGLMLA